MTKMFNVHSLTRRQKEIVLLANYGLSQSQIAKKLFISNGTVGSHICNVYKKTGLRNLKKIAKLIKLDDERFAECQIQKIIDLIHSLLEDRDILHSHCNALYSTLHAFSRKDKEVQHGFQK